MIKTISCSLIDLVSGGDNCTCHGYSQKSLPNPEVTQKVEFFSEAKRISNDFLSRVSWCSALVCNKPQSLKFWSISCSFGNNGLQGTALMHCAGGLLKQYAVITSGRDGII